MFAVWMFVAINGVGAHSQVSVIQNVWVVARSGRPITVINRCGKPLRLFIVLLNLVVRNAQPAYIGSIVLALLLSRVLF
jgi:hypothetical protein